MKKLAQYVALIILVSLICSAEICWAIVVITVSGNPGTITITAPTNAGELPTNQGDSGTTMNWNSDEGLTHKITAQLSAAYPTGINLYVQVSTPGDDGGTSTGEQQIPVSPAEVDLVMGINVCDVTNQTITYTVKITEMAAPGTYDRTVTFTIKDQ